MVLLKRNTRFIVLVGVLLLVGLAIACTNDDAPRSQSTPVSTENNLAQPLQPVMRLHYGEQVSRNRHLSAGQMEELDSILSDRF